MATLTFEGDTLIALVAAAKSNRKPIKLVHDEGIYLCVHYGDKKVAVCYANGYDPTKADRTVVWDKARDAVGGDDFAETVPTNPQFIDTLLIPGAQLKVSVTAKRMSFSVLGPKPEPKTGDEARTAFEASATKSGYKVLQWFSDTHCEMRTPNGNITQYRKGRGRKWNPVPGTSRKAA